MCVTTLHTCVWLYLAFMCVSTLHSCVWLPCIHVCDYTLHSCVWVYLAYMRVTTMHSCVSPSKGVVTHMYARYSHSWMQGSHAHVCMVFTHMNARWTTPLDGATPAQGGRQLQGVEGEQPAQLEALALPRADDRPEGSARGLHQVREQHLFVLTRCREHRNMIDVTLKVTKIN